MSTDPFGDGAQNDNEADDFLTGGTTVIAVKFPVKGAKNEGTVTEWQFPVQKTDMETGELLYFEGKKLVKESDLKNPKGARPANQMLLDIKLNADDPQIGKTWETNQYIEKPVPDDDGMRRAYVSGALQKALGEALKEAGEKYSLPGGVAKLEKGAYVELVRTESKKMPSGFYAYGFKARWTPAKYNERATSDFLTEGEDENPFA